MKRPKLTAEMREKKSGSTGRRFRRAGVLPAIVYGQDSPNVMVLINTKEFAHLEQDIAGENIVIDLAIAGEKKLTPVAIREVQRDPVTDDFVHIDFLRLSLTEKIKFELPVHIVGESIGVKEGGILDRLTRSIEIRCLPDELPPHIDVDITNLQINQSIHVGDIELPENIEIVSPAETTLFSVLPPKVEVEEVVEAEEGAEEIAAVEETAEPELVTKAKPEKEEKKKE